MAVAAPTITVAEEVSTEQLFYDVERELTTVSVLVPPAMLVGGYPEPLAPEALCQRLRALLTPVWTPRWRKAVNAKPRPKMTKAKQSGAHTSMHPLVTAAQRSPRPQKAAA